jgi:hypothetical protein
MKNPVFFAALVLFGLAAVPGSALAHGDVTCHGGPKADWKSQDVLKAQLTGEGWKIRKVEVSKDCYEVYATTPEGQKVEAFFNPASLAKVIVLRRGQVIYRAPGH